MVWTGNPAIPALLDTALEIDKAVQAEYAAANPGTLSTSQTVIEDGQTFEVEGGSVTVAVINRVPAFAFTPEGG